MKNLIFFTHYWGEFHRKLFENYGLPSAMAYDIPELIKLGYNVEWRVYCDKPIENKPDFMTFHGAGYPIEETFGETLRASVGADAGVFIAMPDLFFGKETLINAVKILDGKPGISLCVPHCRVSAGKMTPIDFCDFDNRKLVRYAFEHAHHCLANSFDNVDTNMTWEGMSIRKIKEGMFAVVHTLPSVLLCQFNKHDIDVFNTKVKSWGDMDRMFIRVLKDTERVKVCGSSDLCFMAEVTPDSHQPPLKSGMLNNDRHGWGCNYFNEVLSLWQY